MWRDTHPPQQGIEMVQEITALNSSHLDLPRACPPSSFPLSCRPGIEWVKTWNRIDSRSSVLDRDARGGAYYAHLLSGGLPAYVQQTGFATRGPTTSVPYVDTAVGPNILPKYLDERILRVPNVMRMGAQHMQPSPFGAMCLLKAQCIPSQPSPHEVA